MNKTCGKCIHWERVTNYKEVISDDGICNIIHNKVTVNVSYGWNGGYIYGYHTEEDFGCNLFKSNEGENE